MEIPSVNVFDLDSYLILALHNLKYNRDDVLKISNELDRLIFSEDFKKVKKQSDKVCEQMMLPELILIEM
jgi:hypothetical protein